MLYKYRFINILLKNDNKNTECGRSYSLPLIRLQDKNRPVITLIIIINISIITAYYFVLKITKSDTTRCLVVWNFEGKNLPRKNW